MDNALILGFPGVGKSTVVKAMNHGVHASERLFIDLDIKGRKPNSPEVKSTLGVLTQQYLDDGLFVLTFLNYINMDKLRPDTKIVIAYPDPDIKEEWIARIRKRQPSGTDFIKEISDNWENWLYDWIFAFQTLKRFDDVTVVKLGSDDYLIDVLEDLGIIKLTAHAFRYVELLVKRNLGYLL